jgi:hypothetical protein
MRIKETLGKIINKLMSENKLRNLGSLLKKSLEVDPQDYKELNRKKSTRSRKDFIWFT